MPVITIETRIEASPMRCFDLARDIGTHQESLADTGERAIAGVTTGMLGLGDSVTWEATHLGIRQRLTATITVFEPPLRFVDEMVRGIFHAFTHTHDFIPIADGTLMVDTFRYTAPLGSIGRLADVLFLNRYMVRLLTARAQALKHAAESGPQSHNALVACQG